MPINPAEQKFFDKLAALASAAPPAKPLAEQTVAEFREGAKLFLEFCGKAVDIPLKNMAIAARDGYKIPIRIFEPTNNPHSPLLIFYPGCGYIGDLFESNAVACSRIAKYSDYKVIVVGHRFAPEYPLPKSIEDAYDATNYIANHPAEFGIDPNQLFIGGISSGANCAAVISQWVTQTQAFKIKGQILFNGYYDVSQANLDYIEFEKEDKIFSRQEVMPYVIKLWQIPKEKYCDPVFSPCYFDNMKQLPRTTILVGEYDGLRSDSEAYYAKLKQSRANVEKIVLQGQSHNTLAIPELFEGEIDPAQTIAEILTQ